MKDIFAALIATLFLSIVFEPRAVEAQEKKVYRVGYLNSTNPTINAPWLNAFRQGLRELGWTEGQNVSIEYRWADGNTDRLSAFASDLVKLQVDVIVTSGNAGVRAARQDAGLVFAGATFEAEDTRRNYGERRIVCFGVLQERIVVVGYTPRGADRHIFSMRKANDREKKRIAPLLGL